MVGRWTSKEPMRFAGGRNFYIYGLNDPINMLDVNGKFPFSRERSIYEWLHHQLARLGSYPEAVEIFESNYQEMVEVNTIGADKYYHCLANCEAASIGRSDVAEAISDSREWVDQNIKGDPAGASTCDQQANEWGRNSGSSNWHDCTVWCAIYRPLSLDQSGRR